MKLKFEKIMKSRVFTDPTRKIIDNSIILDDYIKRLENAITETQKHKKNKYNELIAKLDALSPLKTLIRGYSIVEKEGKIIKSAKQVNKLDEISIKFIDGKIQAKVL